MTTDIKIVGGELIRRIMDADMVFNILCYQA